ncbi:MAG: SurA N-terminal domain-containing protein [Alphaproteobacteria bacterium]|nr:SurA N-terminal domain-containing protein [Alphaproteobacteria bacterium]
MLQQMRKYTKSWVSSLFLGLLALSFGVWGIADIFRGSSDTSVATVGGEKIPIELFQRDYRNLTRAAAQQGPIKPAAARAYGQQVLDGLINEAALNTYLNRYGIMATDDTVSARIRAMQNFIGPLGTFDHNTFQRLIDQAGFTEEGFIEYMRGVLEREQFLGAAGSGLQMPPGYARAFFNYLNEARAADYMVIPVTAAGIVPAPSDAELNAYLKAHVSRFSTPEYRQVTYAWIAPSDVASKITVSDVQMKQAYEFDKAKYVVPEKRQLEQITYPDLPSAKAARLKIDSGSSFSDLARARGLNPADIELGDLTKADLGERGVAVFALAKDGVTAPLKAPVGFALIHVVNITPGTSRSFEEVKEELRKKIADQLATAKIGDIANQYIDANSRGQDIAKAAASVGMHVANLAAVDAHGNTPEGGKARIPSDPELLAQVFKAEVGEEGDPFSAKSGTSYVIKVVGVRPPKLKSLETVRAEATAAWQKERQLRQLEAKAKSISEMASAQGSLKAAAASVGVTVQSSGPLRRPQPKRPLPGPLPLPLVTKVFSVPAGKAVYGPTSDHSAYIVALVTAVQHPPAFVLRGSGLRRFAGQVGTSAGQDIAGAVAAAARSKAGVSIEQKTVDRLTGENS